MQIYIPIWFYLYVEGEKEGVKVCIFTFQYGSTYIKDSISEMIMLSIFTFQYGSTYI